MCGFDYFFLEARCRFFMRRYFSKASEGNRVLVEAREFFHVNEEMKRVYNLALERKERAFVFLDGDVGLGKGDLIWRLSSQGYATFSHPFLPWLMKQRRQEQSNDDASSWAKKNLPRLSRQWQHDFSSSLLKFNVQEGRPGFLFVAQSPISSLLQLARRLDLDFRPDLQNVSSMWLPRLQRLPALFFSLHADEIVIQRRAAHKLYLAASDTEEMAVRNALNEMVERGAEDAVPLLKSCFGSSSEGLFVSDTLNTTSTKQAVANILTRVGVAKPTFGKT